MADRPVSNRRRNYERGAVADVADASENPWDEAPDASERAADAWPDTYTDGPSAYEEYADVPSARYSREDLSTAGRPSNEFHDAYDGADAADAADDDSTAHDELLDDGRSDEEQHMTNLYADEPADTASSAYVPRAYAGGAQRDVQIERPHTRVQDSSRYHDATPGEAYYYDERYPEATDDEDADAFPAFFHHSVGTYGEYNLLARCYLELRQMLSFTLTSVSLLLLGNLAFASYFNPLRKSPPKARCDPEFERRVTGERLSERVEYYASFWGYRCEEYEITTRAGWILKAHRISDPRRPGGRGYPVILQHGILCNSLFFFTNEERSLGFWLVDQGFDVWSTNIRSNFGAGHTRFSRWDPRFWAWSVMELAYDLVDVVDFVLDTTGHKQVAYVGHSQGTGSMFLALSHGKYPELGHKLSSFTALGPAVFPGPSLQRLPFRLMQMFQSRFAWSFVFGVRDFFPIIELGRSLLPSFAFGHLAFLVFAYLFDFHDHNWVDRLKPKIFRATGIPTSSELLYFYMRSFVGRGCLFDPRVSTPWFPRAFPPLTIVYGTTDYLVLGKPLVDRLLKYERNVEIVHILELQGYEHMDMVLGVDAFKIVFPRIKDTIVRTMDPEDVPTKVLHG